MRKWCINCLVDLIEDNWPGYLRNNHNHRCLKCYRKQMTKYQDIYREKNRASAREATQKWRTANPEKYAAQLERAKLARKEKK